MTMPNEVLPGAFGHTWQAPYEESEEPTAEVKMGAAELALKGQDRLLSMPEQGVYAVFDGMGGHGDQNAGALASQLAAGTGWDEYEADTTFGNDIETEKERLKSWLLQADRAIALNGRMGTTAAAMRLVEQEGRLHVVWASVGDSRLYIARDDKIMQINEDEGYGHVLTNYLGGGKARVNQIGSFALEFGDRLMLCSDGITGDYEPDVLSGDELAVAFNADTPQAAADMFLRMSRKKDDKTVIVMDIDEDLTTSVLQERYLLADERLKINTNRPLELRGSYNVAGQISAGDKDLLLLDLRVTPASSRGRMSFGPSAGFWEADFLLVDETFFDKWGRPSYGEGGFKGIRGVQTVEFGREYAYERFDFPIEMSREHFAIEYDGEDVYVINRQPTNPTIVTMNK